MGSCGVAGGTCDLKKGCGWREGIGSSSSSSSFGRLDIGLPFTL